MQGLKANKENYNVRFELGVTPDKAKKPERSQVLPGTFRGSGGTSTDNTDHQLSESSNVLNERNFNSPSKFSLADDSNNEPSVKSREDFTRKQPNSISHSEEVEKVYGLVRKALTDD